MKADLENFLRKGQRQRDFITTINAGLRSVDLCTKPSFRIQKASVQDLTGWGTTCSKFDLTSNPGRPWDLMRFHFQVQIFQSFFTHKSWASAPSQRIKCFQLSPESPRTIKCIHDGYFICQQFCAAGTIIDTTDRGLAFIPASPAAEVAIQPGTKVHTLDGVPVTDEEVWERLHTNHTGNHEIPIRMVNTHELLVAWPSRTRSA